MPDLKMLSRAAAGAVVIAWTIAAGSAQQPAGAPMAQVLKNYMPVTAERLLKPDESDWLMIRRTYDGWGYSPLAQITTDNVKRLKPAWVASTGVTSGHQAPPIRSEERRVGKECRL